MHMHESKEQKNRTDKTLGGYYGFDFSRSNGSKSEIRKKGLSKNIEEKNTTKIHF